MDASVLRREPCVIRQLLTSFSSLGYQQKELNLEKRETGNLSEVQFFDQRLFLRAEVRIREKLKFGYSRRIYRHVFSEYASQNGNGIRVIF